MHWYFIVLGVFFLEWEEFVIGGPIFELVFKARGNNHLNMRCWGWWNLWTRLLVVFLLEHNLQPNSDNVLYLSEIIFFQSSSFFLCYIHYIEGIFIYQFDGIRGCTCKAWMIKVGLLIPTIFRCYRSKAVWVAHKNIAGLALVLAFKFLSTRITHDGSLWLRTNFGSLLDQDFTVYSSRRESISSFIIVFWSFSRF